MLHIYKLKTNCALKSFYLIELPSGEECAFIYNCQPSTVSNGNSSGAQMYIYVVGVLQLFVL